MSLLPGSLLSRERDSSDSHRNAEGHSTLKTASGGRAGETGDQLPEAGPWLIPSLRWLCGCRAWGAPENSELGAKAVGRWGGCKSYSGESVEEGDALARCLPHRTILQAQGGHELELGLRVATSLSLGRVRWRWEEWQRHVGWKGSVRGS